jgi:hypothetical protein
VLRMWAPGRFWGQRLVFWPDVADEAWLDMIATTSPPSSAKPWATPGEMAKALDRTTIQTPALDLIDEHLVDVAEGECERLIISMPPQEGKSERASRRFPLWMLHRNPNLRIAIVSYGHDVARRFGAEDPRRPPRPTPSSASPCRSPTTPSTSSSSSATAAASSASASKAR